MSNQTVNSKSMYQFTSFMQPSLLDDHHIGHVGGQGGGSRFPTGRDTALFPNSASRSPVQEPGDGVLGFTAAFSMVVTY